MWKRVAHAAGLLTGSALTGSGQNSGRVVDRVGSNIQFGSLTGPGQKSGSGQTFGPLIGSDQKSGSGTSQVRDDVIMASSSTSASGN